MALRKIRITGDPILRKKSREITEIDERIQELLEDMVETMHAENGVGLAAPQVGVLRRAIVVDIGEGPIKMINPVILDEEGELIDVEGCLSVPEFNGTVIRPEKIKVEYIDEKSERQEIVAEKLFARVICHEVDHINGVLFTDKYIDEVKYTKQEDDEA